VTHPSQQLEVCRSCRRHWHGGCAAQWGRTCECLCEFLDHPVPEDLSYLDVGDDAA
jgi:hypothetical protein